VYKANQLKLICFTEVTVLCSDNLNQFQTGWVIVGTITTESFGVYSNAIPSQNPPQSALTTIL